MVLQEPYIFSGTISENIGLGIDDSDMKRILEVTDLAGASSFINGFPMGYETRVGERGMGLSGGQRQRIAMARGLYNDPRILILDEATNTLDTDSEREVQANLDVLLKGRTSLVVAHRLSTVRSADLIVVLDRGHIVEHGSHEDLINRRGLYCLLAGDQLFLSAERDPMSERAPV